MKLSSKEYEELIRKHPGLKPTEVIKAQNTHAEFMDAVNVCLASKFTNGLIVQEKCVKSPRTLKFSIPGQPVGKPRMSQRDKWQKRPCVMRYRAWADKARASVPKGEILGIYREISFVAYLEFPKSYSITKRAWLTGQPHFQKPDGDNVLKAILDSLFPEDKCIWKFSGEKRWEDGRGPRIEVELR